jgi:peptidoglycan/LPS O-acetylase OafA/YrhL
VFPNQLIRAVTAYLVGARHLPDLWNNNTGARLTPVTDSGDHLGKAVRPSPLRPGNPLNITLATNQIIRTIPFLVHVHRTRGLAVLLVVALHLVEMAGWDYNDLAHCWVSVLLGGGSTIFLFISGFLFWPQFKKYSATGFLRRKFKTVVLPYLIISVPALVIYVLNVKTNHRWLGAEFFDLPIWKEILFLLGTGAHLGPLWFIPTLILILIVSPVLAVFNRHPNAYRILPFFLLLTIVVPRPAMDDNPIQAFVHFLPIYICGMLFHQHHDAYLSFLERRPARCFFVLTGTVVVLFFLSKVWFGMSTLMRVPEVLVLISMMHVTKARDLKIWPVLDYLAMTSFTIYLLHGYLAGFGHAFIQLAAPLSQSVVLLRHIILTSITVALCVGIAFVSKQLLGDRSKYVVGY